MLKFDCFRNTVADLVTNRFPMFFDFEADSDIEVGTTVDSEFAAAADAVRLTGVDVEVFFEGETDPFGSGLTTLTGDVLGVSDVFGTAAPGSVIVTCVAAPAGYTFNAPTTNPGTPAAHPTGDAEFDCFRNTVADLVTNRFPMFFDFEADSDIEVGTTVDSEFLAAADAVRLTGVDVEVFFEGESTPFGSG